MKTLIMMAIGMMLPLAAGGLVYSQPTPTMYTVDNIYYYLVEGTEAAWGAHSLEPQSGVPGGSVPGYSKNLGDIYDDTKVGFDRCAAVPGDVAEGVTFWSTATTAWGVQTGTLAVGGLPVTGQTTSYADYDDGYYEMGTAFSYQTSDPAANGDIVTTDNVSGLMWASDGNAAGCYNWGTKTWDEALTWANGLTFAGYSDWRLPNINELYSICVKDATILAPYIDHTYFPNTVWDYYWSSTSSPSGTVNALVVDFGSGLVKDSDKTHPGYVRAVRGGELN